MSAPLEGSVSRLRKVAIVVPTYREAANIPLLADRIQKALAEQPWSYSLTIVDDNSADGTPEVVERLVTQGHPISLCIRKDERGLSSAVVHGFRQMADKADVLVCMDADLSHEPESLPSLIAALESPEVDFALGSRYVPGASVYEGWTLFRFLNSHIATLLALPFTRVRDPMSGFFAIPSTRFRAARNLNPCGYKIALELIVKCDCRTVKEVPIHFAPRQHGESKLSIREQFTYLRHVRRLLRHKYPTRAELAMFATVGASGAVIDLGCYAALLHTDLRLELARGLAIATAMSWNWWFNRCLTFGESREHHRPLPQYLRYVLINSLGAVISWSVSVGMTYALGGADGNLFRKLGTAALGIASGTLFNFTLSKIWVYRARPQNSASEVPH